MAMGKTTPSVRGRRGVMDAYKRMDWPRQALVEGGSEELSMEQCTGNRKMLLNSLSEDEKAQSRIPDGDGAVEAPPAEELL